VLENSWQQVEIQKLATRVKEVTTVLLTGAASSGELAGELTPSLERISALITEISNFVSVYSTRGLVRRIASQATDRKAIEGYNRRLNSASSELKLHMTLRARQQTTTLSSRIAWEALRNYTTPRVISFRNLPTHFWGEASLVEDRSTPQFQEDKDETETEHTAMVELDQAYSPNQSGGFGTIYRGFYQEAGSSGESQLVAIKHLRVLSGRAGDQLQTSFKKEADIWSNLHHSNILVLLGLTRPRPGRRTPMCLVSPWMPNGDVMGYLRANPDVNIKPLIRGTAHGLSYLHLDVKPVVVHGDVKGANILVDQDGTPKLGDFGLSVYLDLTQITTTTTAFAGSDFWKAPERLSPEDFGLRIAQSRAPASDVYSFGMTMYEIMSGARPYRNMNNYQATAAIMGGRRPPVPDEWKVDPSKEKLLKIMEDCWQQTPPDRPDMERVLADLE